MLAKKGFNDNVRVHDVRSRINTQLLLPDFNRIAYPHRYSMITQYVGKNQIEKVKKYGNYPDFVPLKETGGEEMVTRSLLYFIEYAKIPEGANIRIDAYRYYHTTYITNDWYSENYDKKGVLCVRKEGVDATYQVRKKKNDSTFVWKVDTGEILMIEDGANIVQNFSTVFLEENAYLDLLVFSY